mmetsp:Transcript_9786/g.14910  ORF Transcript_9786/g.14910 Transcript_9786/m.14910 type:complete len:82 (-) Transcript_9786:25-270(-)
MPNFHQPYKRTASTAVLLMSKFFWAQRKDFRIPPRYPHERFIIDWLHQFVLATINRSLSKILHMSINEGQMLRGWKDWKLA